MEKSYDRIKTGRLSLIIMIVMTAVIAMHGLILYHLTRAYQEFKQHPEAVERRKVKRK